MEVKILKIDKVREIVEEKLLCSSHNMEHVKRVYNTCTLLAKDEKIINTEVLELAALLHDIARIEEDEDKTGLIDHAILGAKMAAEILRDLEYDESTIISVAECIKTHRFRMGEKPSTREAMILYDADKIDILGAIGVARSYMIAGRYDEPIYRDIDIEKYIRENLYGGTNSGRIMDISKHSPNLEYHLKLLDIPKKLFTNKGKEIALKRLEFMKNFFEELDREIGGNEK